jgi:AcrR family transcriptional regulator
VAEIEREVPVSEPDAEAPGDRAGYGTPSTRHAIVTSAHRVVRRYGVRRTTVEDVARAAGVSRPTIYAYFGDRQGLIDAVLLWNGHLIRLELEKRFAEAPTFADKVVAAAVFGTSDADPLRIGESEPDSLALMLTTAGGPWLERAAAFWVPLVREAQEAGEVRPELDAHLAARWIARSLFALSAMSSAAPDEGELAEVRDLARTHLAGGLA